MSRIPKIQNSLIALALFLSGCLDSSSMNNQDSTEWLIPVNEVRDGGPGKDGIPALNSPQMIDANQATYLENDDLVLGLVMGDNISAFPHRILDWHEIINETFAGEKLSIIYCPLTGTGIAWERVIDGRETTFGVSGLLYNTNIIPYDRETDSNWSQMLFKSVNGRLAGTQAETINLVETTWKTWKEMYPNTKVVSRNTGFNRSYNYPYGDYKTNHNAIFFPVSRRDNRLPAKQRVLGCLINEQLKVYDLDTFGDDNKLINDEFQGKKLIILGNKQSNFIVAFENNLDGREHVFQAIQNRLPIILKDEIGNEYDVFGKVQAGPDFGKQLKPIRQMMSYWFSWAPFYPTIELFEAGN